MSNLSSVILNVSSETIIWSWCSIFWNWRWCCLQSGIWVLVITSLFLIKWFLLHTFVQITLWRGGGWVFFLSCNFCHYWRHCIFPVCLEESTIASISFTKSWILVSMRVCPSYRALILPSISFNSVSVLCCMSCNHFFVSFVASCLSLFARKISCWKLFFKDDFVRASALFVSCCSPAYLWEFFSLTLVFVRSTIGDGGGGAVFVISSFFE